MLAYIFGYKQRELEAHGGVALHKREKKLVTVE
jgi:hypothetical protein